MSEEGLPSSAAETTLSHLMTSLDANPLGIVHGGIIMKLVDETAGITAGRHAGGPAVTVSMDEMSFVEPVHIGSLVHATGRVNWTGHTSLEISVHVEAGPWDKVAASKTVAVAHLVFVAIDSDGKPRPVPPLMVETDDDRRRFAEAEIRREHRLARREAILESRRKSGHT